jgi:hypothetical protein
VFDDDSRPTNAQRLTQAFVGTRLRFQQRRRNSDDREESKESNGAQRPMRGLQLGGCKRGGKAARRAHELERVFRRSQVKHTHDYETPAPRADEVCGVDPARAFTMGDEREPDRIGCAEERDRKQQVSERKPYGLQRIPQELLGPKRQRRSERWG